MPTAHDRASILSTCPHMPPRNAPHSTVIPLYRAYLRQIRLLPAEYLRQFFRIKATQDIRSVWETRDHDGLRNRKIKRVRKDVKKLTTALEGNIDAFQHILDVAYGRKGGLRWDIMKPILSDPNAPLPARIIADSARSRPPVYSPELTALLTSTHSRTTKPLDKGHLISPPVLPKRVDYSSEEARLLGPLSKRREVNLRWRYFTREWRKVVPPVQLCVKETSHLGDSMPTTSDRTSLTRAGIRGLGLQGSRVLEEVQDMAGPAWKPATIPRRARQCASQQVLRNSEQTDPFDSSLPTRWLRKRYQDLLGRMPILTYHYRTDAPQKKPPGRYEVTLAPSAISSHVRYAAHRRPPVDDSNLSWIPEIGQEDGDKQLRKGKPKDN